MMLMLTTTADLMMLMLATTADLMMLVLTTTADLIYANANVRSSAVTHVCLVVAAEQRRSQRPSLRLRPPPHAVAAPSLPLRNLN